MIKVKVILHLRGLGSTYGRSGKLISWCFLKEREISAVFNDSKILILANVIAGQRAGLMSNSMGCTIFISFTQN